MTGVHVDEGPTVQFSTFLMQTSVVPVMQAHTVTVSMLQQHQDNVLMVTTVEMDQIRAPLQVDT